jgi:hypothetical protein
MIVYHPVFAARLIIVLLILNFVTAIVLFCSSVIVPLSKLIRRQILHNFNNYFRSFALKVVNS